MSAAAPAWRLLVSPALSGAENMALDEALMTRARESGETVLRVYSWRAPTLSFGRNQAARGAYDPARATERGVEVVRRPTGGRALLHHREITYSVTAPVVNDEPLGAAYARINRLLLDGLRRLGVRELHAAEPGARAPLPTGAPCFETPTAGELVAGGAKLVGSAQYREGGALLQHGSILVDDDQTTLLAELATRPLDGVPAPATLRQLLRRAPDVQEVADALFDAVRALEDGGARPFVADEDALEALATRAAALRPRYEDAGWTWRR